jgi:hypothetical protein
MPRPHGLWTCLSRGPWTAQGEAARIPSLPDLLQPGVEGHGSLSVSFGVGADLFLEPLAHFVLFDIEIVLSLES